MAFYLNEFKKHLQSLSDKVDHPYDEPARRHLNNKTTGSLEEAYSAMKQPRMGSYQRPAPSMLNEQGGMPGGDGFGGPPLGGPMQTRGRPQPTNPDGTPYKYPDLGFDGKFVGDIVIVNGQTYYWNGYGWVEADYSTGGM